MERATSLLSSHVFLSLKKVGGKIIEGLKDPGKDPSQKCSPLMG